MVVVVTCRQGHQFPEHLCTQIHDHLVPHPVNSIRTKECSDASNKEYDQDEHGSPVHHRVILVHERAVKKRFEQCRQQRLRRGSHSHTQDRNGKRPPMRAHVSHQAQIELPAGHLPGAPGILSAHRPAASCRQAMRTTSAHPPPSQYRTPPLRHTARSIALRWTHIGQHSCYRNSRPTDKSSHWQ